MDCNIFKKRLENYVLGNISNDLKIALEKHMEECERCKRLYEEEVQIDTAFKSVLSIDGIEFNSSRNSIINSIDKNRYSKKTSNKIFFNFRKYKNRYLSYAVASVAVIVLVPIVLKGFTGENFNYATSKKDTAMYEKDEAKSKEYSEGTSDGISSQRNLVVGTTEEGQLQKYNSDLTDSKEENVPLELKRSIVTQKDLPTYAMEWKNSAGESSATIDIRPEKDVDFGIHGIYIKNVNTNEIVKYEVINNERQYTPRSIEWWDEEHLIIVAGFGYGTIEYGSEVYSLDINTGKLSTLYERKDKKYQILDVKKTGNDLIFQLLIYNDDTYNAFHNGVGKMTLLQLDKPVDMEILGEEKK